MPEKAVSTTYLGPAAPKHAQAIIQSNKNASNGLVVEAESPVSYQVRIVLP